MERLTLNRRPKTADRTECLPAGDGLPIWTTIPLDAKLPMMQNPRGSVVLFTTKLGEAKHRCKQEYDFDLRDPNGQYICNEYKPLHDPHLKAHFNSTMMRRHLIKKGFISEDGKILCSLKEFNQYRQYLRHIFFLEIAHERKEQLERHQNVLSRGSDVARKVSQGTVVRKRLQHQREEDLKKLKKDIAVKADRLEQRLKAIRSEMANRERRQKEEAERRQMAIYKNQRETEQRNIMLMKRWRQRERMRSRLMHDREAQCCLKAEMKCLAKWNTRKEAQQNKLERDEVILRQEEGQRMKNISRRERVVNKQRHQLEERIDSLKQKTREEMQRGNEAYAKRFQKLTARDLRSWRKRKGKKGAPQTKTFNSTWKLEDVLRTFEVPEVIKKEPLHSSHSLQQPLQQHSSRETTGDFSEEDEILIQDKARQIVHDVIENVKSELAMKFDEKECEATQSRSVRFRSEEQEIDVIVTDPLAEDAENEESAQFRPVVEHILTPCASQLEIQRMEAEALLGSPVTENTSTASFVETLLLRLLDDLNRGRLSRDDIMKLASYSMEIIQSTETEALKDTIITEVSEESDSEGPYLAASSSSILARKLVDFTLGKILEEIQSGNVHHDDLASLTVSLLDTAACGDGSDSLSISDTELEAYIDDTLRAASTSAQDPREDSPVCDALLDEFMINTLKKLIQDLEEEALTKSQVHTLAISVHEESKRLLPDKTAFDIQSTKDIQIVLMDILAQLQTGGIDMQALYQIVFAIVYSYNMIIAPPTACFENKVTELMKDIFKTLEQKAAEENLAGVNVNVLHEAVSRLSRTHLSVDTIEKISSSIISVVSQPEISCRTTTSEIARSIVEEALLKAQHCLKSNKVDESVAQGVQHVAESVLVNVDSGSDTNIADSPTLSDVFIDFLGSLQSVVKVTGDTAEFPEGELEELITQITCGMLPSDQIEEIATSVVRILKSPVKTESSMTASVVVKNVLMKVKEDLVNGSVEESLVNEMAETLKICCRAACANDSKSPALLHSLSSFLRTLLNHVTFKVECGEFDEQDIAELSKVLKDNIDKSTTFLWQEENDGPATANRHIVTKDETTSVHKEDFAEHQPTTNLEEMSYLQDARTVLEHLNILLCEIEAEVLDNETANELAQKLIDCGNRLLVSLSKKGSNIPTPGTDTVAEEVVEEVIRTLQLEIDSGMLSNESLKEVTKVLMSTKSDSDIASELVGYTIKGIYRDIQRGYELRQIPSIPTVTKSPSVSTIASHVVGHTLDMINKEIASKGITKQMLRSIASSIMTLVTEEDGPSLEEFKNVRKTVIKIIECLKDDKISQRDAEQIFKMILDKYKVYVLGSGHDVAASKSVENLSIEDNDIVEELVKETLHNIERSIIKGRMGNKEFSIPSLSHSEDSSVIAERLIDACFESMRQDCIESKMPPWPKPDIVDFILDILKKLKEELAAGNVTELSMAHFFQAISNDPTNLKVLESRALENLSKVIAHVQEHRTNSIYVHQILETYLSPDQTHESVYTDPVKAIESILVSVSSDILTKFVKATIQNILMEIREGNTAVVKKPTSMYILRSATSIIADNVIKEVISRIKADMSTSVHQLQGNVNIQELERAASRLLCDSPNTEPTTELEKAQELSKHSTSSVMSKDVEDLVLETLHNAVSNLRLEESIQSQKKCKASDEKDSVASHEIQDFVLHSLQNIVTDLQDRRSHADLEPIRAEKLSYANSIELLRAESADAMAYVNAVLQAVIQDMKTELANKSVNDFHDGPETADDLNMEAMIMGNLQNAVSGCTLQPDEYKLECTQMEEVKRILEESISGTISNIQQGKFDAESLLSMYIAVSRFIGKDAAVIENTESVTVAEVMDLMENVLTMIETMGLDEDTLNKIATHLATLGMDSPVVSERTSTSLSCVSSVSSSKISDLVKDVLKKISNKLMTGDDEDEAESMKSSKSSKSSQKNRNYNRRLSASSTTTSTSVGTHNNTNQKLLGKKVAPNDKATIGKASESDKPVYSYSQPQGKKKLQKRTSDPNPVIQKEVKVKSLSPRIEDIPRPVKNNQQKTPKVQEVRHASIMGSCEKSKLKKTSNKDDVNRNFGPITPKIPHVKTSKSEGKTKKPVLDKPDNKGSLNSLKHSSSVQKTAPALKTGSHRKLSGKKVIAGTPDKISKVPLSPDSVSEEPLELKSLCGSHKTKLKLRGNVQSTETIPGGKDLSPF